MSRSVVITGLGPISGLGIGIEPTWQTVRAGRCVIGPIEAFDASGFDTRIASEVEGFKANQVVPKPYRKAVKVMARDIELAVGAADAAARDAHLRTKGTEPDAFRQDDFVGDYPSNRMGAQIGAGLIAADLDELTEALATARDEQGAFDMGAWGETGMSQLTPLWLLKYLPNMLACHVTIIHDTHAPSNTITCGEASGALSIGESLRVIQRDHADLCFCGGTESKLNPMAFMRQQLAGRLNTADNDRPEQAVRPFDQSAAGYIIGEGGGIVILEAEDTFRKRVQNGQANGARAYAKVLGFGASQTVHLPSRNREPDPEGRAIRSAIRAALREAQVEPEAIDLIVAFGLAVPAYDQAEAAALRGVFGDDLDKIPIYSPKALAGSCGAGSGGLEVALAAKAISEGLIPPVINCEDPLPGLNAGNAPAREADLRHVLVLGSSFAGQNAALVLGKAQG